MKIVKHTILILKFTIRLVFILLITNTGFGQTSYQIFAPKSTGKLKIDGILDEEVWARADIAKDFYQKFPYDTSFSQTKTLVRITYDDDFLYVGAECFDQLEGPYIISSLRRDFTSTSDFFEFYLDPFKDGTNGFCFGVNPLGVEREGLISGGGTVLYDWDNKWYSSVKKYDTVWIAEMAIPFKSIRYKKESISWKVNFARNDLKRNEQSSWVPVPRNFDIQNLAFTGVINFELPLKGVGTNVSIIPYLNSKVGKDYVTQKSERENFNAGGDAKVAVTSSLNLDLTINPDFSQVEVDRQVTNLSRFEIFFPERRQFFLENSDLFSDFGFNWIKPFFSRRVGAGEDPYTGTFQQIPILYGARLSGKLNDDWRIGLLNSQVASRPSIDLKANNYTVAAIQRKVFARSNIGFILVNKQDTEDSLGNFKLATNNYNRTAGVDFNLASKDNRWRGKTFYHQLLTPNPVGRQNTHGGNIFYFDRKLYAEWTHEYVGENYQPKAGYVPRTNYWRIEPYTMYYFYPRNNKLINNHGPGVWAELVMEPKSIASLDSSSRWMEKIFSVNKVLDGFVDFSYKFRFSNTSSLSLSWRRSYVYLYFPFDPTGTGGMKIEAGKGFYTNNTVISFVSDTRKLFNYKVEGSAGGYYNGKIQSVNGAFNYRIQPYGNISLAYSFNNISLPEPFASKTLVLIGPGVDLAFSKSIFLNTTIQYNNQIKNLNNYFRLQWRFRPVSDLFLVYTENYYSSHLGVKNRGVILKLSYWLNI